jgi:hypothetical protein
MFLSLKDFALIDATEMTDDNVAYGISESLDGIVIGKRIREYINGKKEDVSNIRDEDLIFLSKIDDMDAPFDDFYEFKKFLKESLENCTNYADSPDLYVDQAQQLIEKVEQNQEKIEQAANNHSKGIRTKKTLKKLPSIFSKIWRSIFQAPEVKLTIKEIGKTIYECKRNTPDMLLTDRVLEDVKSMSINYAKMSNETADAISVQYVRPRDLAMVYIVRVATDLIACGSYHVYRGWLKDEGKYLLRVVHYLLGELESSGHISQEERLQFESDIQQDIKRAG